MSEAPGGKSHSPVLIAIASWALPGLGYWLLGLRTRALYAGISILALYLLGILIGGIRVADPPGYGQWGYKVQLVARYYNHRRTPTADVYRVDPISPEEQANPARQGQGGDYTDRPLGWALSNQAMAEVGNKPWFVGQVLCGPVSFAMALVSLDAAHPASLPTSSTMPVKEGVAASHSRSWEIGTLYTAVAGMLNLLAIIDAAFRATQASTEAA